MSGSCTKTLDETDVDIRRLDDISGCGPSQSVLTSENLPNDGVEDAFHSAWDHFRADSRGGLRRCRTGIFASNDRN
jgi:hypothetical protein